MNNYEEESVVTSPTYNTDRKCLYVRKPLKSKI